MTELIFATVALVWQIISAGIGAAIRKMRAPKPKPLCAECFHAHVQYAANALRAISCTYAVRCVR